MKHATCFAITSTDNAVYAKAYKHAIGRTVFLPTKLDDLMQLVTINKPCVDGRRFGNF